MINHHRRRLQPHRSLEVRDQLQRTQLDDLLVAKGIGNYHAAPPAQVPKGPPSSRTHPALHQKKTYVGRRQEGSRSTGSIHRLTTVTMGVTMACSSLNGV